MLPPLRLLPLLLLAGAEASVWPLPASVSGAGGPPRLLQQPLAFNVSAGDSPELRQAISRCAALMFPHGVAGAGGGATARIARVDIAVAAVVRSATMDTDESYRISVPAAGKAIVVTAATTIGAYRALESLSQLVEYVFAKECYTIGSVAIADKPRFGWRGLMLDTSRHFQPVAGILRTLDGMACTFHRQSGCMSRDFWPLSDRV